MPLISIIIPIYNAAAYLSDCVTAFLRQKTADFELLLIDDGSTDESGSICDSFAASDSRVRVFRQENAGVSAARNLGIREARGKFIYFADSDDLPAPASLSFLAELAVPDTDIAVFSVEMIEKDTRTVYKTGDGVLTPSALLRKFCTDEIPRILFCAPWSKLFRADLLRQNGLFFDTSLSLGEDTAFMLRALRFAKTVKTDSRILYRYMRVNAGSLFSSFRADTYSSFLAVYRLSSETARHFMLDAAALSCLTASYVKDLMANAVKAVRFAAPETRYAYFSALSEDSVLQSHLAVLRPNPHTCFLAKLILHRHYKTAFVFCRVHDFLKGRRYC